MRRSARKAVPFSIRLQAEEHGLTPGQIRIARAYDGEFTDEIDQLLARGRRSEEEMLVRYPFIQTFEAAVGDSTTN